MENPPWMKMYFLLKMVIFQPVMLVFRGGKAILVVGFPLSLTSIQRKKRVDQTCFFVYLFPLLVGFLFEKTLPGKLIHTIHVWYIYLHLP